MVCGRQGDAILAYNNWAFYSAGMCFSSEAQKHRLLFGYVFLFFPFYDVYVKI